MNADALYAAILANPDDDAPRLVYADWFEEHGDIDRASFIRAQIRQSHLDGPANLNPSTTERNAFYRQSRDLLHQHEKTWLAGVPRDLQHRGVEFHRGFVEELTLTINQVLKVSKKMWASHPIQWLTLSEVAGNFGRLLAMPQLSRIRRLLLHASLNETDLAALATTQNLSQLRDLAILGGRGNALADALARCPSLGGLTHLRMSDWPGLDAEGLATFTASANVQRLQMWSLGADSLGPAVAGVLARSPGLANLKHLFLRGQIGDEGLAALADSPHLGSLRLLHLHKHQIGPEGATALAATNHLTHLQIVNLASNPIGPAGASALAAAAWNDLARLELEACKLGDEGAVALAECRSWPALISLTLNGNGITAEGVRALARSPQMQNLVWLSLMSNKIGDEGGMALAQSQTLGKLQTLVLNSCGPFSPAVEAALRERFGQELSL